MAPAFRGDPPAVKLVSLASLLIYDVRNLSFAHGLEGEVTNVFLHKGKSFGSVVRNDLQLLCSFALRGASQLRANDAKPRLAAS